MERPLDILTYLINEYLSEFSKDTVFDIVNHILRDIYYKEKKLTRDQLDLFYMGLSELRTFPFILEELESYQEAKEYRKTDEYHHYTKILDHYMGKNGKKIFKLSTWE